MDTTYFSTRQDLKKLGVPTYPGCRQEAVDFAINTLGIPLDEILNGFDDKQVLEAIDWAATQMDLYPDEEEVDESEE